MAKLSVRHAAIAQQVERILGKDEVASSNLASSSKESVIPIGMADFFVMGEYSFPTLDRFLLFSFLVL